MKIKNFVLALLIILTSTFRCNKKELSPYEQSPYPKQIHDCLEAMNYQMGDEKKYATLIGVSEENANDCNIQAMFATKEDIKKFNETRIQKGLNPDYVLFKGRKINIVKSIGSTCNHN